MVGVLGMNIFGMVMGLGWGRGRGFGIGLGAWAWVWARDHGADMGLRPGAPGMERADAVLEGQTEKK